MDFDIWVSVLFSPLGKVVGRAIYFTVRNFNLFFLFLARSANLPEGLYILPMFFLYFFIFFLMVDFLANVAETLIEQSSPKFQDW